MNEKANRAIDSQVARSTPMTKKWVCAKTGIRLVVRSIAPKIGCAICREIIANRSVYATRVEEAILLVRLDDRAPKIMQATTNGSK
jgi:hypothetical protein